MGNLTDRTRRDVYVQADASSGDGSRERPYGSIREVLQKHLEDWGQVFLGPGIYREDVVIERDGMWLFPWKQYDVVIEGSITIKGRGNAIRGLTFNSRDRAIVIAAGAEGCEIQNNRVLELSDEGIGLHLEDGALVIGNVVDLQDCNAKGTTGIRVGVGRGVGALCLDHNRVAGAECGLRILDPQDELMAPWRITHNEVRDCRIGVHGPLGHLIFRYNRIWRCGKMAVGGVAGVIGSNTIREIADVSWKTDPEADQEGSDAQETRRTLHVVCGAASGGEGTPEHPYGTLYEALTSLAGGDTVMVGPGDYRETVTVSALAPPEAPIRIMSSERHAAVMVEGSIRLEDCSNVRIEGFRFLASPDAVVFGPDARHCALKDCRLATVEGKRSCRVPVLGPSASNNLIEDCVFEGRDRECDGIPLACQRFNQHLVVRRCRISGYSNGVQTGYGSYPTAPPGYHVIENCEFFDNIDGVHCKMTDGVVRNCHLHHNSGFGITVRYGARQLIESNRIHHNGTGIRLHSPSHLVRNNLICLNQNGGIVASTFMGEPFYEPPTGVFIVNNTLWRNGGPAIRLEQGARLAWLRNIIVGESMDQPLVVREDTEQKAEWEFSGAIRMADFNLYHQGTAPLLNEHEGGEHDLFADPRLVDPAGGDFRLGEGSPALNAVPKSWLGLPPVPFGTGDDEPWRSLGARLRTGIFQQHSRITE
jgi:hypothetical protein